TGGGHGTEKRQGRGRLRSFPARRSRRSGRGSPEGESGTGRALGGFPLRIRRRRRLRPLPRRLHGSGTEKPQLGRRKAGPPQGGSGSRGCRFQGDPGRSLTTLSPLAPPGGFLV